MKSKISIGLVHKGQPENSALIVYGGYLPKSGRVVKAIKRAGWLPQQY